MVSVVSRSKHGPSVKHYEIMFHARKYRAGGPGPKATLMVVVEHMGEVDGEWYCWPSAREIASSTEQSLGTVRRHIAAFEAQGLIERRTRGREGGGRDSNLLVLNTAALADQSAHDARFASDQSAHPEGAKRASGESAPYIEQPRTTTRGAEAPEPAPEPVADPPPEPATATARTATPRGEAKRAKDQARAEAELLVRAWWEERAAAGNPVGQPWIACVGVVATMLRQGVAGSRIEWALRHAPVVSTAALEMAIQRRLNGQNGHPSRGPTTGNHVEVAMRVREQLLAKEREASHG